MAIGKKDLSKPVMVRHNCTNPIFIDFRDFAHIFEVCTAAAFSEAVFAISMAFFSANTA